MAGLFRISFQGLPDPRTGNARRHDLLEVLTIALTASICGAESCVDFALFARDRRALFAEFLDLAGGLPSHDTFSRIFRLLDPAALARCVEQFLGQLGEDGAGVLAIDGKTLRRSFDRAAGRSVLHVVTAFVSGARMVVEQRAVAAGENEITAARALLELFDLNGVLVTGDPSLSGADRADHPGAGRRLAVPAQGQPPGAAGRGGALLRRPGGGVGRRPRHHRRRSRPHRGPPALDQLGGGVAGLRPPLSRRGRPAGPEDPGPDRAHRHRDRPAHDDHPHPLSLLRSTGCQSPGPGRARPLEHRGRRPLGARHQL